MTEASPALGLPTASPELAERLLTGLSAVDELLRTVVDHEDPFIAAASMHLSDAGGKRFRPMLTLLAAELGTGINDEVVMAATGVGLRGGRWTSTGGDLVVFSLSRYRLVRDLAVSGVVVWDRTAHVVSFSVTTLVSTFPHPS